MNAERLLDVYEQISEAPDAITRLRRFVLDLAVRGKLVEQDAADEPAARLVQRIEEKKAEILSETAMRKPRKVADMNPAEIWADLPANWVWTQISNLGFISPRNDAEDQIEASFVPMPMIFAEYGIANDHEVRPWAEIKKGYTHFAEGDVGLAKITPCFENGKSTVFRNLTGGFGSGTTELHILRPVLVDSDYVVLFLKSPQFIETGIPKMTGTAGQKRVSSEYFTSSPFPLPPLAEQHRIVAKVDELMALCDRLEEARKTREELRDKLTAASLARLTALDTTAQAEPAKVGTGFASGSATSEDDFPTHAAFALEALPALTTRCDQIKTLRQTILNIAVRGKLVEQDPADEPAAELLKRIESDKKERAVSARDRHAGTINPLGETELPYDIPASWHWVAFGDITISRDGERVPVSKSERENRAKIYDYYGASGVIDKIDGYLFDKPLLLIGEDGANLINRSTPIAFIACGKYWVNNHAHVLDGLNEQFLRYLALFINATDLKPFVTGTAQPKMNQAKMNSIPVALPPLAEQHRIVAKVDALMALCDRLEAALTTADTTRTRLLEALLHEALAPATDTLDAAE